MSVLRNRKEDEVHMCSCCLTVGLREAAKVAQVENFRVFWQVSKLSIRFTKNVMLYLILYVNRVLYDISVEGGEMHMDRNIESTLIYEMCYKE